MCISFLLPIKITPTKNNIHLLFHSFHGPEARAKLLLSFRVSQAEIQMSAGLHFFLEALGENPFPGSFRLLAEFSSMWCGTCFLVPVSFLADPQGLFSTSRGYPHSWEPWLSSTIFKDSNISWIFYFYSLNLSYLIFCLISLTQSSAFKDDVITLGPPG